MSETISKFRHGGPRANSGGARPGAGRPYKIHLEPVIPAGPRWCVYQTHPQGERLATHELTRAGYRTYLPLIAIRKRDAVIRSLFHTVLVPRFTGYGFLFICPTEPIWPVHNTPGVRNLLVGSDGRPSPIPGGEIERHQADDGELCNLKRQVMPEIERGTIVSIREGAFAGQIGRVEECNGLATKVAINAFGRAIGIWMARSSVAT